MATTDRILLDDSLTVRQAAFQAWVEKVRDPAREHSEGLRELIVLNGAAAADYEVAPLPNGRWAVTVHCSYHCGHFHGTGIPWTAFDSRKACIEFFLTTARRHFGYAIGPDGSDLQRRAQAEMARVLQGGLFGFIEPLPSRGYQGLKRHTLFTHEEQDDGEDETATGSRNSDGSDQGDDLGEPDPDRDAAQRDRQPHLQGW